jgi:hypothetical protein
MRKSDHDQRPLFSPYLAWEQLPDTVREQALDVLTTLYLESTEIIKITDHSIDKSSIVENTPPRSQ